MVYSKSAPVVPDIVAIGDEAAPFVGAGAIVDPLSVIVMVRMELILTVPVPVSVGVPLTLPVAASNSSPRGSPVAE